MVYSLFMPSMETYIEWFEKNIPVIEEDGSSTDALILNNSNTKYTCSNCGEVDEYDPDLVRLEELKTCSNCRDRESYTGLLY